MPYAVIVHINLALTQLDPSAASLSSGKAQETALTHPRKILSCPTRHLMAIYWEALVARGTLGQQAVGSLCRTGEYWEAQDLEHEGQRKMS